MSPAILRNAVRHGTVVLLSKLLTTVKLRFLQESGLHTLKNRIFFYPAAALLVIVAAAFIVYVLPDFLTAKLTIRVEDAVSHSWVWDAKITIDNSEMRTFYQSDHGPTDLTFTGLPLGRAILKVTAPNYVTREIPVRLHRGGNRLDAPIELVGYRIPGLDHFAMIEGNSPDAITVQVRPVGKSGIALEHYPCIDLWIGALVSVETRNGKAVLVSSDTTSTRGQPFFRGRIRWKWNSNIADSFRYSASIPYSDLGSAPYLVIDYLVIVPDPRKISAAEVDSMMAKAPDISNMKELTTYLDGQRSGDRFRYYFSTSWNVSRMGATG